MPGAGEANDNDKTRSHAVLMSGMVVGHYKIIEKIGAGGMGEVYLAQDSELKRQVALKFLPARYSADPEAKARFTREAQAAAGLTHENIVHIYEVAEFNGRPYFAMEMVEGRSLRELIKHQELKPERVPELVRQIGLGLSEAHRLGIIHRDIKPANILIDARGRARLVDFGLAHIEGADEITRTGSTMGTVGYMSPEQVQAKQVDSRSDIFSLGVVIYEMLTGQQPFRRENTAATLLAIVNESPEPLDRLGVPVPRQWQRIIDKALVKNRDQRYAKIEDLIADLEAVADETTPPSQRRRRRFVGWTLLIILCSCLAVIIVHGPTREKLFDRLDRNPVPEKKHLAVLPLANIGENHDEQAFCDGMLETITSKLTQLEHYRGMLWVVPASEVREREVTSVGLAHKIFGVTLTVTGSVQRLGGQVRVTLNLVDAKSARQLRSMVIDDSLSNVPALQDSVMVRLADMLDIQLLPEKETLLTAGGTSSPPAYDYYIRGRGYLHYYAQATMLDTAITLFEQALAQDSLYALAYAGLGEAQWRMYQQTVDTSWVGQAVGNCRRALTIDNRLSAGHVALGLILHGTSRHGEAIWEFEHALLLDSANYAALRGLAVAHKSLNQLDEAEAAFVKASILRPDSWGPYFDLAMFYVELGRADEASRPLQQAAVLLPDDYLACNDLGGLYFYLSKTSEATRLWMRSLSIKPNSPAYSNLGTLHFMEKQYIEAAAMYEKALELSGHDYDLMANLAASYMQIPQKREQALATYQQVIELAKERRVISPGDPELLSDLAGYYQIVGQDASARELIDQAIGLAPGNIYLMLKAGLIYEGFGARDSAMMWIARAIDGGYPQDYVESLPDLQELLADPDFDSMMNMTRPAPMEKRETN